MKKPLFFFAFLIIVMFVLCIVFSMKKDFSKPNTFEITDEFEIKKVVYYSSANAISNTTNYQNPEWNLSVYQYTDIAIYLDRINDSNDTKYQNYITELSLENFETDLENSRVYYLNPKNFGNSNLVEDDLIEELLEYNVINSENKENEQNYNIPIFFQDCSNPITLRVVTELSNHYQVSKDYTLAYNGSLVKELGLRLENLNQTISFDLVIHNKGVGRAKHIDLEIPYEDKEKSILDGDIKIEKNKNISF